MKRLWLTCILSLVVFFIPSHAYSQSEKVLSFDATITLVSDSTFVVEEHILYDFGNLERHGIYRDIPYQYERNGLTYKTRLEVLDVSPGPYETSKNAGMLHVKIGDPDVLVTGTQEYVIRYSVERAINYFSDHDELYWDVTGNGWIVPIDEASATVMLPSDLDPSQVQLECFTGSAGSTDAQCTKRLEDPRKVAFASKAPLGIGEGLTIVVGLPKGVVQQPSAWQNILWIIRDNWPFALPIVALLVMLYLWWTRGRDPKDTLAIIPEYEPPTNLRPAEVGVVFDQRADLKDISSTLIDLAIRGYLRIIQGEEKKLLSTTKDYTFTKLKELGEDAKLFEKETFDGLFNGGTTKQLSDLKNNFYKRLADIKTALYKGLVEQGMFPTNPERVRHLYSGIGVGLVVAGFFLLSGLLGGILIASGVIVLLFSLIMPRRTKKGVETYRAIKGFRWFLSVTEKDRLKFHNAPEKKPELFEKFLPYAMVLNVEKEWAKQFEGIYQQQPNWYQGAANVYTAFILSDLINSMSRDMNHTFVSRPGGGGGASGFGGGGFSGGGFGGGGGGSW